MNTYLLNLSATVPSSIDNNILTIGNFDGVHRGHQAMLDQLKASAAKLGCATMVMIFEPHPREYFAKSTGDISKAPARLTSVEEKLALLAMYGIENVIVADFDDTFRSLSASQFADLLTSKLNVQALVLGDDFRFGHDRMGDSQFLRDYGLAVTNLHTITDDNKAQVTDNLDKEDSRISSTRIRECLAMGDIAMANRLLGHDYSMTGVVQHGDKIGRSLDFPTANIALNRVKPALHGIFGVDVVMLDEKGEVLVNGFDVVSEPTSQSGGMKGLRPHSLFGTANIGTRPTINNSHEWRLEVYFPDYKGDLYAKNLNVRFLHYLHAERNYSDLAALKAGILQDVRGLVAWRNAANE